MNKLAKVLLTSVLFFTATTTFAQQEEIEKFAKEIGAMELLESLVPEEAHEPTEVHESAEEHEEEEGFSPIHHVMDAHSIHLWGEGHDAVSVPLPVLLWTENGLVTFMSSEFHHDDQGHHIVEKNGMSFVNLHETIYQLNSGAHAVELDENHHASNATTPFDLSITKVVVAIFIVAILMLLVFTSVAKKYKGDKPKAPKGIASFMEPLVLFVRDFAKENIGETKYMRFMPYLLTVFFFIWFGNLLGLIPFIGGINMTGNISITLMLALMTLIIQIIHSKWAFWSHMLMPPGVPVALYPILVPIELIGLLVKPAALTIRLFANITAGHIIVLSIIGIIFMNHSMGWAGLSVPLALFISVLEVTLVAFLQAYIFTMLSSMFIGSAVDDGHH